MIPTAFNEVLRMESPVQLFARVTQQPYTHEDVTLDPGTRVVVLYGSANRDERHFPDPDRFDVRRRNIDQVAFGSGVHSCPGQNLARLEVHAFFRALAARVGRWEISGTPERKLANTTRALASLPVTVHPA